jgi:hypothetical protein
MDKAVKSGGIGEEEVDEEDEGDLPEERPEEAPLHPVHCMGRQGGFARGLNHGCALPWGII